MSLFALTDQRQRSCQLADEGMFDFSEIASKSGEFREGFPPARDIGHVQ